MSGITAVQAALFGLRMNLDRYNRTAARIARTAPLDDLAENMADLIVSKRGFEANLATFKSADEMIGSLLDTLA
jgi:flagellar basal body rod protein FlgC